MYTPNQFKVRDPKVLNSFLEENSFATLIAARESSIEATHLPILFNQSKDRVSFHLASNNGLKEFLLPCANFLLVFSGPHSYISSRWYSRPDVPTWNYTSVHLSCKIVKTLSGDELVKDLHRLSLKYDQPAFVDQMFSDEFRLIAKNIPALVGYEAEVMDVQAKFKLSQNKDPETQNRIIRELSCSALASERELGEFMECYLRNSVPPKDLR